MGLASTIMRAGFQGLRVLDVPGFTADLKFAELRRRYYDQFWFSVAQETGARWRKWSYGYTRLSRNGTDVIVRGPEVRLDDHLTLDLMGNKLLTYELLQEQGFAVPRHVRFSLRNMTPALDLWRDLGRPIVVKPVSGTGGGRGVTTGITDAGSLRMAAFLASRFDLDLMAEEQIEGQSYRLLFLDGRMIDAVRRDPPRLTGDGKRSIARLAAEENRRRLIGQPFTALSPLVIDRDARLYLAAQGLSARSVPAGGEVVVVKRASNQNNASENHVVRHEVHPATAAACARLVTNLGVTLAGIDIIARDIAKPLANGNGLIGEVNTTPGLHHHHLVANPAGGASVGAVLSEYLFARNKIVSPEAGQAGHLRIAAG